MNEQLVTAMLEQQPPAPPPRRNTLCGSCAQAQCLGQESEEAGCAQRAVRMGLSAIPTLKRGQERSKGSGSGALLRRAVCVLVP